MLLLFAFTVLWLLVLYAEVTTKLRVGCETETVGMTTLTVLFLSLGDVVLMKTRPVEKAAVAGAGQWVTADAPLVRLLG